MAQAEIMLPVRSATLPDDSAGSAMARLVREVTTDGDAPRVVQLVARFDATTTEHLFWQFRLPDNFKAAQAAGRPKLNVQFYLADDQTADNAKVDFEAALGPITPRSAGGGGDDDDLTALDLTGDGGGWVAGPLDLGTQATATAGRLYEVGLDMSGNTDGAAAGDYVILGLRRDADDGMDDTMTGDACVVAVSLTYTVG